MLKESCDIKTKKCSRCKEEFPLTIEFFHKADFLLDGFNSHCKKCRQKSYYLKRQPVKNLEKLLSERFSDLKTRVKNKRVKVTVSLDFDIAYLIGLYNTQSGKCAISGIPMTFVLYNGHNNTNVSIDRIDSSLGYVKTNIQLVCCIVNKMKLDMTIKDLVFYCEKIIKYNEL